MSLLVVYLLVCAFFPQVVRMNTEKQVIYVKGNVPGDIESVLLLKDCVQPEKRLKVCTLFKTYFAVFTYVQVKSERFAFFFFAEWPNSYMDAIIR